MKTGAPRSEPGAPDPRRDVEQILAGQFIILPPAVQFDINEEFLSEDELSPPQAEPAADQGVEPAEATHGALAPVEHVAEAEPTADPHEVSPPSADPTPPHPAVSLAIAAAVDAPPIDPVVVNDETEPGAPSLSIAQ